MNLNPNSLRLYLYMVEIPRAHYTLFEANGRQSQPTNMNPAQYCHKPRILAHTILQMVIEPCTTLSSGPLLCKRQLYG
jgi:hypothetical protein